MTHYYNQILNRGPDLSSWPEKMTYAPALRRMRNTLKRHIEIKGWSPLFETFRMILLTQFMDTKNGFKKMCSKWKKEQYPDIEINTSSKFPYFWGNTLDAQKAVWNLFDSLKPETNSNAEIKLVESLMREFHPMRPGYAELVSLADTLNGVKVAKQKVIFDTVFNYIISMGEDNELLPEQRDIPVAYAEVLLSLFVSCLKQALPDFMTSPEQALFFRAVIFAVGLHTVGTTHDRLFDRMLAPVSDLMEAAVEGDNNREEDPYVEVGEYEDEEEKEEEKEVAYGFDRDDPSDGDDYDFVAPNITEWEYEQAEEELYESPEEEKFGDEPEDAGLLVIADRIDAIVQNDRDYFGYFYSE